MLTELQTPDWEMVFSLSMQHISPAFTDEKCETTAFVIGDVVRIIAMSSGEMFGPNEADEDEDVSCSDGESWIGIFLLQDGRYVFMEAVRGCALTPGFDCDSEGSVKVSRSLPTVIRYALADDDRERLGLELEDK